MTVYLGMRDPGTRRAEVTVDGLRLDPRTDLCNHSPSGFEWGYAGSGPAQLALAIVADHLAKDARSLAWARKIALRSKTEVPILPGRDTDMLAVSVHQAFKRGVVSKIQGDKFTMTGLEVSRALEKLARDR